MTFDEDIILHKCYRNPREILVCAHAVGFGVYGKKIVQMLESEEHWNDFGYVVQGTLQANQQVTIVRPRENSPSSISDSNTIDQIIGVRRFAGVADEVTFVADSIKSNIVNDGIPPEDILIICADDRNAGGYINALRKRLQDRDIHVNNLQDDSFSIRDFQREGAVTISTIYKAKGNEAYVVYILGIDALFYSATPRSRNRAFTAMTRAKGWLYITGIGQVADQFAAEIVLAKRHYPTLSFIYPNPEQIAYMKRDLIQVDPAEAEDTIARLAADMEPDELEYLLKKKLRELQTKRRAKKKLT